MAYYVYLLASQKRGALYTGVTDNLARRIQEHKTGATGGFTQLYGEKTSCTFRHTMTLMSLLHGENASNNGVVPGNLT